MLTRLRLAPHFAVIAGLGASAWLWQENEATPFGVALGVLYALLLAGVGYYASRSYWWIAQLFTCNLLFIGLAPCARASPVAASGGELWLLTTVIATLVGILFFGAPFVAWLDSREARSGSVAAPVDHWLTALWSSLLFEYVLVACALIRDVPLALRIAAALLWIAPKVGFALANERTIRRIRAIDAPWNLERSTVPSRYTPRFDLGIGVHVRTELAPSDGYRDAPVPTRVVIGDAAESIAMIRRQARAYWKGLALTWAAPVVFGLAAGLASGPG